MEKDIFLSGLRAQFEEVDSLNLELHTEFKQMKTWDSLTRFSIIAFIEDEYKVVLTNEDLNKLITPNYLFDFINSRR